MSISTQMDVLDELCSRVGNINLESSRASITSVGKLEDESIYVKEQTGNESVDDNACVQFARLQDTSSVEGSPTVTLPVYITPSTFPGKEGELLLIPARRMSNYNVAIQGPNEKKTESSNVVENDPEDHDCISTVEVMNQISSSNFVTSSELNASDIDKFDENIVQNILNNSFTDLAESDSDEEQTNLNPKEEISKLSSKTVLNSTFTECDLSKGTEESSLYTMEKGSIHYNDSSSTLTSISGVCASLKESCGNILFTEITAKADLDCTESEYCAAESTERLQVIQSDTLLQESNILRCEVVTCDSVVENCELQNEVSSLISKSNTDGMASISKEKESLPYNNSPLKRELKAYVIECSSKDRNEMFQTLSEKLTTHEMKNFQEIAEKTRDCETVLNNSLDVAAEELAEELNVSQITSDVETVLNTSFIESPSSGVTCTETILNTSFIEVEGNGKKDDAEIVTTQKLASNTCEFQKSISDNAINAVEISKSCKNSVEEDRVQDVHNDTFTEELQKLSSENCEFGKSLNDKMVGAVEFSDSDKNCIGKNSIQDICNDTFVEEAVRNLKLKDSPLENSTENVLNTSFMECTSIAGEQMITTENSSCVKTESCGPLSESIERDLSVPEDNGTEETTFEIDTLISVTVNKDPKAVVEGSISFANSIVEGNCASFNGNTAEVVNTSTSPGNIEQAENPFESSLNQTYFENANMEVEENASFIRTERQAQNVSFTEYSGKMDEILVVDTESMKSQNTMLRELSSETLTIHNEMKKNIANETSSKAILNINFTEEFSENIIKSEINALMSIEEPEMNTTLETVKLGMNLPLDTLAPDMNTPLDTVAPEMNTTLNIVKPENTTMDTVESEMNATLDIVKPGVNTSLYTVSPEMNTSLDTESPEMNISLDTVAPEKNISLHTVAPKMNISLDTVAPEMNTSLDTVAPEMNTTLNIVKPENTTMDTVESEMNATLDIVKPGVNTSLYTVSPEMNTSLDTESPEMNISLDTVAPEKNISLHTVSPKMNISLDTVAPEMNTSLDTVSPEMNTSLDTVAPEMNTSLDTVAPEMNTSLDTVAPEMNTSLDTVAPEMNTSLDTVAPEMNTSLDTVAPEMNTSLDTVAPEMNTSLDTVAPEMNTTLDIVEPKMNTTLDIIEPKVNTTLDIVKPKMNTTLDIVASIEDRVDSEINTTDIVVESGLNTTMDIEVSKINTENIVSENRELNSTFCFTETVLDSTFAEPTVPDKIEKPNQDTSQRMTPQNCEMNVLSQAGITSTVPLVCQEVDIENAGKTSSTESIVERVVENQNIRSDDLVHQRKKLSEVPNVTKIDLNLTFDTYSEQPLNISETGREQNATFKELSDSKGAVKVLVNENCDLERGKSALKTDLNSTFVTASDLLFEDSETTQDTTSTTKKNVENQIISSTVLASKDDVLINDTAGVRTDLNSSFLHETQTKVASPNVKAGKIEITQSVKFSQKGMTNNPGVNNGSCKDTSVHEKQIINDESFVNKCKESVSRERNILNAGVLQDSQELVIKKTNQKSVIEKIEASLANNGEETEQITMVPVSDKKDNISTNLTELKSNSISSSNEVCSFTPSGITDVYKQSSDVLSHETFNQNPASNNTLNPCAEVQNESVPLQKSDGIENIYEQKHELIEFDAVLNNFSLINLDKKNCDMNRIEKLSIVCAEEMNIPCGKKEVKTPEGEFKCIQMTPNNVGTSTLDHQIKELMAKGALVEDACEKRERTTYMKNPQENRHENILSKDINIEIQRNLDGICPVVEALPSQKLKPEELSTATIDLLTPAANEFLSNGENEQFQDSNFVFGDEVFKDPSTFDFLTQFGNSTSLRDLRKESLYIKFDPLVGSPRSATASDKPLPIVNIVREEERGENEKINITAEANNEKRETLHGICKGVSEGSVESFLRSKSPLVGPKELQDESALLKLKEYQEECNSLKAQIAELQEIIKAKDEVHKNEITKYTSQIVALDFDLARQGEIISQYKKDLEEKEGEKLAFDSIMSEYEKLLSQLVTEKEQNCIEFNQKEFKLTKELKECREKLAETEQKLSIAQQKCENLQNSMKKHVDTLLVKMKSYEKAVEKEKQKYATIKEHAAEQLESANEKLMAEEKRHKLECTKYTSSIANLELQVTNLQNLLDQKTKENDTLMAMCNELVERFEH